MWSNGSLSTRQSHPLDAAKMFCSEIHREEVIIDKKLTFE